MKDKYTNNIRRWYDKDPVLSKSMKILEESDDETQIKIALNLIKVIIEHNVADSNYLAVDDILTAVEDGRSEEGGQHGRWYDIDSTIKTAITMLESCPEITQKRIAKEMAKMVVDKIKEDIDFEEAENDDDDNDENNLDDIE